MDIGQLEPQPHGLFGLTGGLSRADQGDDGVQVVQSYLEPFQDMGAFLRAGQLELGSTDNDFASVLDEVVDKLPEVQNSGLVVHDGQEDDSERLLHLGVFVQVVQNHIRDLPPLQIQHHPDPFPVGLVSDVSDPLDALLRDQTGDLFNEPRLVD